jgi:UDP-glucose 4-epimerase
MAAMRAINSGTPLPIYGDGTAVRDYLDADDLAEAIITVARSDPKAGLWNVGSGVGHSVLDIIDMVEEVTGKRPRIEFRPNRGIDVPHAVLDPSKIFQDFGWKATTPLLLSLKKALADQCPG